MSAADANGGGFLHRCLDGHPQLRAYPFELQLGVSGYRDGLTSDIDPKYRWPRFARPEGSDGSLFDAIIDDEVKGRIDPTRSTKLDHYPLDVELEDWRIRFSERLAGRRGRADIIEAYVESLFDQWVDRPASPREIAIAAHCPSWIVDVDLILADFPRARIVHLVRSPFTAFHDLHARHGDALDLVAFCRKWNRATQLALHFAARDERVEVASYAGLLDLHADSVSGDSASDGRHPEPTGEWRRIAAHFDIELAASLARPTFAGSPVPDRGPVFGGVPAHSLEYEASTREELPIEVARRLAQLTLGVRRQLGWPDRLDPE